MKLKTVELLLRGKAAISVNIGRATKLSNDKLIAKLVTKVASIEFLQFLNINPINTKFNKILLPLYITCKYFYLLKLMLTATYLLVEDYYTGRVNSIELKKQTKQIRVPMNRQAKGEGDRKTANDVEDRESRRLSFGVALLNANVYTSVKCNKRCFAMHLNEVYCFDYARLIEADGCLSCRCSNATLSLSDNLSAMNESKVIMAMKGTMTQ